MVRSWRRESCVLRPAPPWSMPAEAASAFLLAVVIAMEVEGAGGFEDAVQLQDDERGYGFSTVTNTGSAANVVFTTKFSEMLAVRPMSCLSAGAAVLAAVNVIVP